MLRLKLGSRSYTFFRVSGPRHGTASCSTLALQYHHPPPIPNPKPLAPTCAATPLPVHPIARAPKNREGRGRGRGREEKRREGKLARACRRRSSPKTGWGSFPLSIFPISMVFPHCSWWCRLLCVVVRQGLMQGRRRNGAESP
jgi:hypothetical protein